MTTQINLTENYGKHLKDKIVQDPSNALRGEVTITVKDKTTGKVEEQQKHNLIVYGGREWLLKKAFASNVDSGNNEFLANSEILWFGAGCGGSEPGNPLQCGSTYGSDNDLYQPIRLRYDFDGNDESLNPYYASRVMNNGDIVNGYYKKISYVGIKEDLANPYKKNNVTMYPNLIAEIRLEVSTDDIAGQQYLGDNFTKTYADINEIALFIADKRLSDPGRSGKVTSISKDYYNFDEVAKRYYFEPMNNVCPHIISEDKKTWTWTTDVPFNNNNVQFFDVYERNTPVSKDVNYNYTEKDANGNITYYNLTNKLNDKPFMLGAYVSGQNKCSGTLTLSGSQITYSFANGSVQNSGSVTLSQNTSATTLTNLVICAHGTVFIKSDKETKISDYCGDTQIKSKVTYRNGFNDSFKTLSPEENVFVTSNSHVYYFPVGYKYNDAKELVADSEFTSMSHVRVTQSSDIYRIIEVAEINSDDNSTECKFYINNSDVQYISEGMKMYTYGENGNIVPETNPATITEVYDAASDTGLNSTVQRSYFIIDRADLVSQSFENGLRCKIYNEGNTSPYIMFNRATISTLRCSRNREIAVIWRLYF